MSAKYKTLTLKEKRVVLIDLINEDTQRFNNKYYDDTAVLRVSETDMKIAETIQSLGCDRSKILKIIELLLGRKLPISKKHNISLHGFSFVMVVPLECCNGHIYPIGQPVLQGYVNSGDYMYRVNGLKGNNIGTQRTTLRPATLDEIVAFVTKAPTYVITEIFAKVIVIDRSK